jgi:hypothetical protein
METNQTPNNLPINVDWLQLYCTRPDDEVCFKTNYYEIKTLPIKTRHFNIWEEIYYQGRRIATINRVPCSPVLPKNMILVKFDNSYLYSGDIALNAKIFLEQMKLTLKSITRIDVCIDFQEFHNHRKPENLIKYFLSGQLLKKGKSQFQVNGKQEVKIPIKEKSNYIRESKNNIYIKLDEVQALGKNHHQVNLQYLKFGGQNSNIKYYLYNKTQEMQQKTDKPWIRQVHKIAEFEESEDVWRIEFSITNSNANLTDCETGEIIHLKNLECLKRQNIVALFWSLFSKYFVFLKVGSDSNKSRMKQIKLLDKPDMIRLFQWDVPKTKSDRADKIFIKKLHEHYDELRRLRPQLAESNDAIKKQYIEERNLNRWAFEKGFIDSPIPENPYKYAEISKSLINK